MKRTIFTAIALASLLFAACGDKDKDKADEETVVDPAGEQAAKPAGDETKPAGEETEPAAGDTAATDMLQAQVSMLEQLSAALTENKDDCAAAAEAIKNVVSEHQDLLAKGQEMGAADPDLARKMAENEELKAAQAEFTTAMTENCPGDENVMAAIQTMAPKQ